MEYPGGATGTEDFATRAGPNDECERYRRTQPVQARKCRKCVCVGRVPLELQVACYEARRCENRGDHGFQLQYLGGESHQCSKQQQSPGRQHMSLDS
eukprot:1271279-Amphidinium_carterae.2